MCQRTSVEGGGSANVGSGKGFMEKITFSLGLAWGDLRNEPRGERPSGPKS